MSSLDTDEKVATRVARAKRAAFLRMEQLQRWAERKGLTQIYLLRPGSDNFRTVLGSCWVRVVPREGELIKLKRAPWAEKDWEGWCKVEKIEHMLMLENEGDLFLGSAHVFVHVVKYQ